MTENTTDDLEWLENRLRSVGRVITKGQTEADGMWMATLVLDLHYSVKIKAHTLAELVSKGKEYEANREARKLSFFILDFNNP